MGTQVPFDDLDSIEKYHVPLDDFILPGAPSTFKYPLFSAIQGIVDPDTGRTTRHLNLDDPIARLPSKNDMVWMTRIMTMLTGLFNDRPNFIAETMPSVVSGPIIDGK